jgi:hypothetical protein
MTVDAVDPVDMMDERLASMLPDDSEFEGAARAGKRSETTLREG